MRLMMQDREMTTCDLLQNRILDEYRINIQKLYRSHTQVNDLGFIKYLVKVETEKYLEEPAGNFISLLEPAGIKTEIKPSNKIGYRYMAVIGFHEKPYLEVYLFFNQLKYVNPNGFSKRKKARLVKKEKLQEINVYNASLCVNGCDD